MSADLPRTVDLHRVGDADLRFGEWGPGYLSQTSEAAFGVVVLRPGDEFANHLHRQHTESFVVLEGRAEVWLDRQGPHPIGPGDVLHARPGQEHFLRNPYDVVFRAVFVKAPWVDADKVDAPWTPNP